MVHQHFMLVDTMTVAENIVLGAEPELRLRWISVKRRRRFASFPKSSNSLSIPNAVIESLSVGQQQRVEL